jgi:putative RecB family exonuclease
MIATLDPVQTTPSGPTPEERVRELQQTVSASRLSLYLSCRLKFFFRYVAGLKKPKPAALHVGGAVHATLKSWNKARWRGEVLTLKQLHEEFVKAWADTEGEPVEWDDDELMEQATGWRLLDTYIRSQPFPPKPDAVEVPVEADLKQHGLLRLIGVLDLVQCGNIVDYKTTGQTPNPDRVAHTAEVQTSIYSLLYRENTGRQERGIELHHLVKVKQPKVVVTDLPPMSEDQEARIFTLMEWYVAGLDRRDFVPSPGLQCVNCEFFADCRRWR